MTSKLTREQLHERARENVKALKMASRQTAFESAREEILADLQLAELALAAMDSEPVAYIFKHPAGRLFWSLTDESNKGHDDVMPVYASPQPAPVVPEEKSIPNTLSMYAVDAVAAIAEVKGWNACRAAMLHAGNSPAIPDGYVMVPKVPSQAHLNSIAMRYRHDFYLLNDAQKDSALATARQMYEECSGQGFYTLPAGPQEVNRE
ncbi:hypothetical protein AI2844V1_3536 [Klebsiella pneumoniae]|nr:hypothetical protein AI2844V1_3536 [Klebsiella pneumoniae]CAH5364581.1 hypothetical protein AI2844V1_3536 [Klebsiella pneumoniae]